MGPRNVKNTMVDRMLSIVAPHLCSGCGTTGTLLCEHCKYDIINHPFRGCVLCEELSDVGICDRHGVAYTQAWIVGERQGTLQRLIGGFKFQNMKAAARELAVLLNETLPTLPRDTVIVPVPTAPPHVRERGYDHMLLIAQHFARLRNFPVSQVVERTNSATQHHANRKDRIAQAKSAFQITGSVQPDIPYLLLDDVVTTGSTIARAAQILKNAGAREVWVGAVARQPLD